MREFTDLLVNRQARFERPRSPLPGDLRPSYRIALLALALDACRGKRATLRKLYVLNWAMKSAAGREELRMALAGKTQNVLATRFEPSMGRAVDFAVAELLVEPVGKGRLELTDKGKAFAREIQSAGCLAEEDAFFKLIGNIATEVRISDLLGSKDLFK